MANVRVKNTVAAAMLTALLNAIDGGAGAGLVRFYNGSQPSDAEGAATTLVATLTCADPAGVVSGDTLTFSGISDDISADVATTITWARIVDSNGNTIFDCDVSTSGATINLSSVTTAVGDLVRITSFTIQIP